MSLLRRSDSSRTTPARELSRSSRATSGDWLKTVAVAESFGMVIPVLAFMFNILLTMRGNWSHVRSSVPLLYALTGWASYILVSFQGSNQALRGVNELTHFTAYVPGHAMLALMFFGLFTPFGLVFRLIGRDPLQRRG